LLDTVGGGSGGGGHYEWRLDEAQHWRRAAQPLIEVRGLSEGSHSVTIRAVRGGGGGGGADAVPVRYAWTVDTRAPDTSIVVYPSTVTHLRSAILVFSGSEPGATFEYRLDGGAETALNVTAAAAAAAPAAGVAETWLAPPDNTSVLHLYDLAEGAHVLRVRAVDAAGNADASPAVHKWIVDRAGVYGPPSMPSDVVAGGGDQV
ncbi:hypothetical protein JKP88DRAFT_316511, partial [Tribonema minus]